MNTIAAATREQLIHMIENNMRTEEALKEWDSREGCYYPFKMDYLRRENTL